MKQEIYRLKVCQWAYGWSNSTTIMKIYDYFLLKEFEVLENRLVESRRSAEALVSGMKNNITKQETLYLLKEDKNRTYGNKYIKRKYR